MAEHKIIAVTPAGRRAYLEILKSYVLSDETIAEWHLWDNCRRQSDRLYIEELAKNHPKIKLIRLAATDGTNRAINQFYRTLTDPDVFYIKLDDDIVYLPGNFGKALYDAARAERGQYTYWSPLVVNNAICSWLLKHHSNIFIAEDLNASAACVHGWRSPWFAECLHRAFLDASSEGRLSDFQVPNFEVSLARFSINCIGVFGQDVAALGEDFCPLATDDEEWISAVLPSKTKRPGRVVGNLTVSHFSFFTQEEHLLATDILGRYFALAGVPAVAPPPSPKRPLRARMRRMLELRWFSGKRFYTITSRSHFPQNAATTDQTP